MEQIKEKNRKFREEHLALKLANSYGKDDIDSIKTQTPKYAFGRDNGVLRCKDKKIR